MAFYPDMQRMFFQKGRFLFIPLERKCVALIVVCFMKWPLDPTCPRISKDHHSNDF